jgi:hypothetical protein
MVNEKRVWICLQKEREREREMCNGWFKEEWLYLKGPGGVGNCLRGVKYD